MLERWFLDKPNIVELVIMAGLHKRLEATNAKNPVGYPWESNHESRAPKHTFRPWPIRYFVSVITKILNGT